MSISKMIYFLFSSIVLCLLLGISACSTQTTLYERWNDEQYSGPMLKNVLVLGIFKDDIQRRSFEATFVKEVNAGNKHAVAGYTLMPNAEDSDTKEDILAAVKKMGADSVLITSYKGTVEKQREVPPRVEYIPRTGMGYGRYGYGYGGYYGSRYDMVYQPGYTTTDTIVQLETRVFSVADEKLVWAGKSKSVNVSSGEKVVKELVRLVVKDMKESGLIK
ncbi:MAG: hypothetical protein KZQ64_07730 [gamma proteobacterium symbiont of Bathyaustriella thionipta]|nr:hypothetical protein [gamma proteobacterium symbiont of Bathyaustriella thionipta]MCU7949591.1 hypothetical protein [gamma proteobacterium symbiont of Bathyaustriella thionipta]MCU7953262.1 hypothetical protein [gamma proteobacterium symbiont of Bathyaustriella thionipta]MCU7956183.1 hypothetical protein [gamma proteobacterium symbiont of Bathyaustriella thionipta]MCU7968846.1 hypothetical protein [gamma proteobacterium symbiont of Bathyaustriella thionipta]